MKNEGVIYKVPFYIRKNRYIEDNCDFLCADIKAQIPCHVRACAYVLQQVFGLFYFCHFHFATR